MKMVYLGSEVRDGWTRLLCRYKWDCFATLTFSKRTLCQERAEHCWDRWLWRWQVQTAVERRLLTSETVKITDVYGRPTREVLRLRGWWWNQWRAGRGRPVYVIGLETHQSGGLHIHGMIRWSELLKGLSREAGWRLWRELPPVGLGYGLFARIEPPRSQNDVSAYVSKYVVKGGEVLLSGSFDGHELQPAM
jgi:hypothetical protein